MHAHAHTHTTKSLQEPAPIPQKGNRIRIPRLAFLRYWDKVLEVVQGSKVLRRIPNVVRLFFWTGFNGTRVFTTKAPVEPGEIFGGGKEKLNRRT